MVICLGQCAPSFTPLKFSIIIIKVIIIIIFIFFIFIFFFFFFFHALYIVDTELPFTHLKWSLTSCRIHHQKEDCYNTPIDTTTTKISVPTCCIVLSHFFLHFFHVHIHFFFVFNAILLVSIIFNGITIGVYNLYIGYIIV